MATSKAPGASASSAAREPVSTSPSKNVRLHVFESPNILKAVPVLWAMTTIASGAWLLVSTQAVHMFFGSFISLTASLPFLLRKPYNALSPWTGIAFTLFLTCGARGIVMSLDWSGSKATIEELWTLSREPEYFIRPYLILAAGVLLMTLGYLSPIARHKTDPAASRRWKSLTTFRFNSIFWPAVIASAAIGFAAFALYAYNTGGLSLSGALSLADLSSKRATISGVDLTSEYASYGHLRYLNHFSAVAFFLTLGRYRLIGTAPTTASTLFRYVVLSCLMLNAVALPIFSSSRNHAAQILIIALIIRALIGQSRRVRGTLVAVVLILTMLSAMSFIRGSSQTGAYADAAPSLATAAQVATDGIIYNRNLGDLATTAHIIKSVPTSLPLAHGDTILQYILAPIPRAIWPEKPLISSGPIIGAAIFGNERSGVPPGYFGEMYWNFGLAGILAGGLGLGLLIRFVDTRLLGRPLTASPLGAIVYMIIIFPIGFSLVTSGIGSAAFDLLSTSIILLAVMLVVRERRTLKDSSDAKLSLDGTTRTPPARQSGTGRSAT